VSPASFSQRANIAGSFILISQLSFARIAPDSLNAQRSRFVIGGSSFFSVNK
jgi:hypothetical protein